MANLQIGDTAIPFDLPGVDGKTYSLAGISAGKKATAVVFMCNHCPYVLAWLDRLIAIAAGLCRQGRGLCRHQCQRSGQVCGRQL